MAGTRFKFLLTAVGFLLCLAVSSPVLAASQRTSKRAIKQVSKPAPAPQVPAGPLTQLTLEEMPVTPPQVSYHDNQLTIVAQNSTLGDILRAVHQQTGAIIDTPGNANDRVVVHLGPGPARDVLASLLNGSHFDYVMLGSAENPTAVAHVILTAKSSSQSAPVQQASAGQPAPPPQPEQDATQEVGTDDFATLDDQAEEDTPPDQVQADDQQQAQQQQQQLPNGQIMRSPEQLLQELQQRQLLLQQQQQQVNGGGQAPPTPAAPQGFPIPNSNQQEPPQ